MKIGNFLSGTLNATVMCAMTAAAVISVQEARAEEKLAQIEDNDKNCLAKNIFFEARDQETEGRVAVAWVTLNRMESSRYPTTICAVVEQGHRDSNGNPIRNKCQFSWYCDGKSDNIPDNVIAQRAWSDAQLIAEVVLLDWARGKRGPVFGATMYHADYVNPYWSDSYQRVAQIDTHIFYK
jgi:spore germination cell wall hydrolase CwlJ-like protein